MYWKPYTDLDRSFSWVFCSSHSCFFWWFWQLSPSPALQMQALPRKWRILKPCTNVTGKTGRKYRNGDRGPFVLLQLRLFSLFLHIWSSRTCQSNMQGLSRTQSSMHLP
ncbi:unnamed protein product [Kuraishia capsulata CBS 1993]|uniref:Uncharacterized protein n=1 Tax=Kuraishia capsulata CBS 1993 TaxID=1382522 RepID=W6MVT7_9ASCO|nr:uncharacterized protein KUCA_T00002487001 [Kuraishia capsulata CBS 1993]CDK26515.1 unnamed protein product [Kuraishia capsulata CBS 1993]